MNWFTVYLIVLVDYLQLQQWKFSGEIPLSNLHGFKILNVLLHCFNKAIEIEPNAGFAKYMYLGQLSEGLEAVKQYEKGVHIMEEERDKHNKMQVNVILQCNVYTIVKLVIPGIKSFNLAIKPLPNSKKLC